MEKLIEKISQWHHDRNLIEGATSKDQVLKLIQEVGELSDSVCKKQDVKDDIGDCLVILINIAEREGTNLEEGLEHPAIVRKLVKEWKLTPAEVEDIIREQEEFLTTWGKGEIV